MIDMKPAIVRYEGKSEGSKGKFTHGKCYEAFFLEYWEGVRDSLHVRGDDGLVTDFNKFEDFTVISDDDNLLNDYEAIVRCVTHDYDDELFDLNYDVEYKAIGRDKDGMYLVMDESYCCYFYEPDCFEIVEDKHGILSRRSVYYSYNGGDEIQKW
jgi:hypothetical protein